MSYSTGIPITQRKQTLHYERCTDMFSSSTLEIIIFLIAKNLNFPESDIHRVNDP